jgi:hypothetical protein
MIKFEKIQPGMILYDVRKSGVRFSGRKWDVWSVRVFEVDQEKRRVFASWNGNAPHWIYERAVTKYRATNPNEVKP